MFKDIIGWEYGYMISNTGEVYSKKNDKILKTTISKTGYHQITLRKHGIAYCFKIHRLVATAFIPNPNEYPIINHIDGNKLNNNYLNLEWCTYSYNTIHAYDNGLAKAMCGVDNPRSILTENDVRLIRELYIPGKIGKRKISKMLNLPLHAVGGVLRSSGANWKHVD